MTVAASTEHLHLRDTARDYARRELEPHAESWDRTASFPAEAVRGLAELGFLALLVPEEEGGSGFDTVGFCLAVEEVSRAVPALGWLLAVHGGPVTRLVRAASEDVRAAWLSRLASGDALGALALAEPQGGSDDGSVETGVRRVDGTLRITGTKAWVSGAGIARAGVVFAREEGHSAAPHPRGEQGAARNSHETAARATPPRPFLVDLAAAGVVVGAREDTMGLRALPVAAVELRDARVEGGSALGVSDDGADAAVLGRLGAAAQALGVAGRCIELAVSYAAERRQFGRSVATFQGVRVPLADLAARLAAARALLYTAAAARDGQAAPGGTPGEGETAPGVAASMAKLLATELAMAAALQAVQAHGGYGYVKDYPVERFFRDAKAGQLFEGPNDIHRLLIADSLFGS